MLAPLIAPHAPGYPRWSNDFFALGARLSTFANSANLLDLLGGEFKWTKAGHGRLPPLRPVPSTYAQDEEPQRSISKVCRAER